MLSGGLKYIVCCWCSCFLHSQLFASLSVLYFSFLSLPQAPKLILMVFLAGSFLPPLHLLFSWVSILSSRFIISGPLPRQSMGALAIEFNGGRVNTFCCFHPFPSQQRHPQDGWNNSASAAVGGVREMAKELSSSLGIRPLN